MTVKVVFYTNKIEHLENNTIFKNICQPLISIGHFGPIYCVPTGRFL